MSLTEKAVLPGSQSTTCTYNNKLLFICLEEVIINLYCC